MKKEVPAHTYFIKMLKETAGLPSIDNTIKYNSIFARQIERRIREEVARVKGIKKEEVEKDDILKGFAELLKLAEKNDWIRPRMKDLGILYRNFGRIIQ